MNRTLRLLAFAALCLAAAVDASAEPITHRASGIVFPDRIGSFARTGAEDHEAKRPGLGAAFGYRSASGAVATVFVYTAGLSPVPASVDHPVMGRLRQATIGEIQEFSRGRNETAKQTVSATEAVSTDAGQVTVMYDGFTVESPTMSRNTYVWLWTSRGFLVKVRLTTPMIEGAPGEQKAFYEAVVRLAAPPRQ
jgi:hypothetical protein